MINPSIPIPVICKDIDEGARVCIDLRKVTYYGEDWYPEEEGGPCVTVFFDSGNQTTIDHTFDEFSQLCEEAAQRHIELFRPTANTVNTVNRGYDPQEFRS